MKKPRRNPLLLVLVALALVGGLVASNLLGQRGVQTFDAHDHDHDGKPDHGSDTHD